MKEHSPPTDEQLSKVHEDLNSLLKEHEPIVEDNINHPPHYNQHPTGLECQLFNLNLPYPLGCAVKYLWRAGKKKGSSRLEDLQKAAWYLEKYQDGAPTPCPEEVEAVVRHPDTCKHLSALLWELYQPVRYDKSAIPDILINIGKDILSLSNGEIKSPILLPDWAPEVSQELKEAPTNTNPCNHGCTFDKDQCKGLSAKQVRQKYPRFEGKCETCGYDGIYYDSYAHYIYGDW